PLIVTATEFDRRIPRGLENPTSNNPGAGHGQTATFTMHGYGVNGGKARGYRMTSSTGSLGMINGVNYENPTPVDPQTGLPSNTGTIYGQMALLPTVCQIFGAVVPPQQVTDQAAFPAAI